jgi:hypothetical protein
MRICRRCRIIIIHFGMLTTACKAWCPLLPGYGCLLLLVYDRLSFPSHVRMFSTPPLPSNRLLLLLHLSRVEMHNRWMVRDHGVSSIQPAVLPNYGARRCSRWTRKTAWSSKTRCFASSLTKYRSSVGRHREGIEDDTRRIQNRLDTRQAKHDKAERRFSPPKMVVISSRFCGRRTPDLRSNDRQGRRSVELPSGS